MADEPLDVPEPIDWAYWRLGAAVMGWFGVALLVIAALLGLASTDSAGLGWAIGIGFGGILLFVPGVVFWTFAVVVESRAVPSRNSQTSPVAKRPDAREPEPPGSCL